MAKAGSSDLLKIVGLVVVIVAAVAFLVFYVFKASGGQTEVVGTIEMGGKEAETRIAPDERGAAPETFDPQMQQEQGGGGRGN